MKVTHRDITLDDNYPVYICQYWDFGSNFPANIKKFLKQCTELEIPYIVADITADVKFFRKQFTHLTEPRERQLRCRYLPEGLRDIAQQYLPENRSFMYTHADVILKKKFPQEWFKGMSVGYCLGQCGKDSHNKHFMSTPVYFRGDCTSRELLDLWAYKCRNVNTHDSEHRFISVTCQKDYAKHKKVKRFPEEACSRVPSGNLYCVHPQ